MNSPAPILRMQGITKRFPGVLALDGVSFDLLPGEVHCLLGGNGAGKSTLMKILSCADSADAGEITLNGLRVSPASPAHAQRLGISAVHQDLRLVPDLTVAENILLGHEPADRMGWFIDNADLGSRAEKVMGQLGEMIPVDRPVRELSPAEGQIVSIARALSHSARILILDEPTASLTQRETQNLFRIIAQLRNSNVSVIYISHRLQEVFEIGDRLTVLRDGRVAAVRSVSECSIPELIECMVGRTLEKEFPVMSSPGKNELMRVEGLSSRRFHDVSFILHAGEVLGLAGLAGAGRTEIVRALFGADPIRTGRIVMDGRPFLPSSPVDAIRAGIGLLTEDRNGQGLFFNMNIRENVSIAHLARGQHGLLHYPASEINETEPFLRRLEVRTAAESSVATLSGGNRQKVVLARWLFTQCRILMFDEPTSGVDISGKFEIYRLIAELAAQGAGILLISSDLPELIGLCHRIVVLREGEVVGELDHADADQTAVLKLAVPV